MSFALSRPKDRGCQGASSWFSFLLQQTLVFHGVVELLSRERPEQLLLEESGTFQSLDTLRRS